MIDQKQVENIREFGVSSEDSARARLDILADQIGFRMDKAAEYVIVGGCFQPGAMPSVFEDLKLLLEMLKIDYTFLSKEYCCGWMPVGQPAVMMKNEEDIQEFRIISRELIVENFKQAEALGARSIALFCAACEPNYSNCKNETGLEFISYADLLERHFEKGKLEMEIDYYPGCYRFRRKITHQTLDTGSALHLMDRIAGLKVNQVDSKLCCYIPPHLGQISGSLRTDTLVTVCTGCYHNLKAMLADKEQQKVWILPELVLKAIQEKV
jgi:Fe-S oxidoreductase